MYLGQSSVEDPELKDAVRTILLAGEQVGSVVGLGLGAFGGYELGTAVAQASQATDMVQMAGLAGAALCAYVGYKIGKPLGVIGTIIGLGAVSLVGSLLGVPIAALENYRMNKDLKEEVQADVNAFSALEMKLAEVLPEEVFQDLTAEDLPFQHSSAIYETEEGEIRLYRIPGISVTAHSTTDFLKHPNMPEEPKSFNEENKPWEEYWNAARTLSEGLKLRFTGEEYNAPTHHFQTELKEGTGGELEDVTRRLLGAEKALDTFLREGVPPDESIRDLTEPRPVIY